MPDRRLTSLRKLVLPLAFLVVVAVAVQALAGRPDGCHKGSCDNEPPWVRIDRPADGSTIDGAVRVAGIAGDDVKIARVDVAVDGHRFRRADGVRDWVYTLDATTLGVGWHRVVVRATDKAGNQDRSSVDLLVASTTSPGPEAGFTPEPDPAPEPEPSPTTEPSPDPSTDPSPSDSEAGYMLTPEGAKLYVETDGLDPDGRPWTAQRLYDLLLAEAGADLTVIGPSLSVRLQDARVTQCLASAGSSDGVYSDFEATIYLRGVDSGFSSIPHARLAHEFGHAWGLYHLYITMQGQWEPYLQARGLHSDSRMDTTYAWNREEILADDWRLLFGSDANRAERPNHMNLDIPDPADVPRLAAFLAETWSA